MKPFPRSTLLIILFFIISIGTIEVHAQDNTMEEKEHEFQYDNSLRMSPFRFIGATFRLNYEHYFKNHRRSLVLSPGLRVKEGGSRSTIGVETEAQYRFYLSHLIQGKNKTLGMRSIGFYTAPYITYAYLVEEFVQDDRDHTKTVHSMAGGLVMGLQFNITDRLVIDTYIGGGFQNAQVYNTQSAEYYYSYYNVFDKEYVGMVPNLACQIGFSF